MTVIIGLLGPAGAGKSTVAKHLADHYGATRYSLASPLKEIAMNVLNFTPEQVYGTQAQKETVDERYGFSPRWFLQRLGTEGIRAVFGADVWVDLLLERIKGEHPRLAVIEDVRFENESRKIRRATDSNALACASVWRLETPGRESGADVMHASESEWMRAEYDLRITPPYRDLSLLFSMASDAAQSVGLTRYSEAV